MRFATIFLYFFLLVCCAATAALLMLDKNKTDREFSRTFTIQQFSKPFDLNKGTGVGVVLQQDLDSTFQKGDTLYLLKLK